MKGEEKFGPLSSWLYSALAPVFAGKIYRAIVDQVNRYRPGSLLDVGCGPGTTVRLIASRISGIDLYCVDPSDSMISIANRKIRRYSLSERISATTGSSRKVPFDRKFDMIITSLSYHHWKEREKSLEYLLTLLNDDGVLSIFEMNSSSLNGVYRAGRNHALTENYAHSLSFPGFAKEVEVLGDGKILNIRLRKIETGEVHSTGDLDYRND